MATIKAIEGRTVHQIQSGQVIVDLCSVVKELVENGLDAGATSIEVRFKNQGLESIEVQDNGDGISSHNYETLALKHHTSKLSTYSDLTTLQTFGFRGEALSSLCALSHFSVVTCIAADAPKGTKLEFEVSGKLKGQSTVAVPKGTTVTVENLFNNLPVRRRELERNIKREWGRVIGVLGQYACIQTGIKFSVTQQAGKGKKTTLFSTKGNQSTRENIVNVFGAKTLTALVPLDLNLELEATSAPSQRWSTQDDGGTKEIRIVGHISRPASGEGRQTPDRQMFFVNSRPCGLPQVAKAFNEVYRSYNASQSPFIFANIELDTHLYDVNVSPDKRTILLHDQTRMLENLKTALTELFESQDYTVPISQLPTQKQPTYKQLTISRESTTASTSRSPAPEVPRGRDVSTEVDESVAASSRRAQSEDVEEVQRRDRHPAVSSASMAKASEGVSLISNWAGRMTNDRTDPKTVVSEAVPEVQDGGLSKDKRLLIEKLRREGELAQAAEELADPPESSVFTTQNSDDAPSSSYHVPQAVADFNERMAEARQARQQSAQASHGATDSEEEPIPAFKSPAKPPLSIADKYSSAVRSQRPPAEMATITIGDETITSSIGTPCPPRSWVGSAVTTARTTARPQVEEPTRPTFGSLLSQRFNAPGTVREVSSGEIEDTDEERHAEDSQSLSQLLSTAVDSVEHDELEQAPISQSAKTTRDDQEHELESSLLAPAQADDEANDDEYIDEDQQKNLEEEKRQEAIKAAEESAILPTQENQTRVKSLLHSNRKNSTLQLVKTVETTVEKIEQQMHDLKNMLVSCQGNSASTDTVDDLALDDDKAEEQLSISKSDFEKMRIIGQFNLGFILATRASNEDVTSPDDLFIIDQHASDEKYNFERLQAVTIVQSQRLVYPKTLDLTALEEEIVLENLPALETNGFIVTVDESGDSTVGNRCQVLSLPLSRETTFSLTDLEELISLLADTPPGTMIPRPSKVRKMFAMRACRSSIMIGRTLTHRQMGKVVRHLGELDKPWNCPHGRPTMRHLCGFKVWDEFGWKEEGGGEDEEEQDDGVGVAIAEFVRRSKEVETEEEEEEVESEDGNEEMDSDEEAGEVEEQEEEVDDEEER